MVKEFLQVAAAFSTQISKERGSIVVLHDRAVEMLYHAVPSPQKTTAQ